MDTIQIVNAIQKARNNKEINRQFIIRELFRLKITEFQNTPITELSYYDLRYLLSISRIQRD